MSYKVTISNKRQQVSAYSTESGIFISSTAFKDGEQPMSAFVSRDENGDIQAQIINESISLAHEKWKEKYSIETLLVDRYVKIFQVVYTILIALIAMVKIPVITVFVSTLWVVSLFTGALHSISFYSSILVYNKLKFPIFPKYHGAEHMAVRAEKKYKRIPTISEIANESIYEYQCSTTNTLLVPTCFSIVKTIIISIVLLSGYYLCTLMTNTWIQSWQYYIIFAFVVVFSILVGKLLSMLPDLIKKCMKNEFILKLFQWAVVSKPGKDEIEIAQQAIRLRYLMNEKISKDQEGYAFEDVSIDVLHKTAIYTFRNGKTGTTTLYEYIESIVAILNAEIEECDDNVSVDEPLDEENCEA